MNTYFGVMQSRWQTLNDKGKNDIYIVVVVVVWFFVCNVGLVLIFDHMLYWYRGRSSCIIDWNINYWDGAGDWNHSSKLTRTCLPNVVYTVAANVLVTKGVWASDLCNYLRVFFLLKSSPSKDLFFYENIFKKIRVKTCRDVPFEVRNIFPTQSMFSTKISSQGYSIENRSFLCAIHWYK